MLKLKKLFSDYWLLLGTDAGFQAMVILWIMLSGYSGNLERQAIGRGFDALSSVDSSLVSLAQSMSDAMEAGVENQRLTGDAITLIFAKLNAMDSTQLSQEFIDQIDSAKVDFARAARNAEVMRDSSAVAWNAAALRISEQVRSEADRVKQDIWNSLYLMFGALALFVLVPLILRNKGTT